MRKKLFIILSVCLISLNATGQSRRAMWVWITGTMLGNTSEENKCINECLNTGITDIYLYAPPALANGTARNNCRAFINKCTCNQISVWGMDGWRGYFSDLCGPTEFYGYIQEMIDYNQLSQPGEKFVGFHGDNEFHVHEASSGCGPADVFHWGSTDAALSTTPGSGLWQSTEKQDRDSLMTDFVLQTETAANMCHGAGLEYSIAVMPWITGVNWTNGAIGSQSTAVMATYKGTTKECFKHLMDYIDEYVIMSYHTNVGGKVKFMCEDELAYADGLSASVRPRVLSGIETHCGVAQYVSYCDTPGEDSKNHVNNEMGQHQVEMGVHVSYTGQAMHDWVGWRDLATVSNNTSSPPGGFCVTGTSSDHLLGVNVSPNPGQDQIEISGGENNIDITILNLDGRTMLQTSDANNKRIDISSLSSGVYLIRVSDERGSRNMKWIKN